MRQLKGMLCFRSLLNPGYKNAGPFFYFGCKHTYSNELICFGSDHFSFAVQNKKKTVKFSIQKKMAANAFRPIGMFEKNQKSITGHFRSEFGL